MKEISVNNSSQDDDYYFEVFHQAEDAIKDILFMYRSCTDYRSINDDMGYEDGKFDPLVYIDCRQDQFGSYDVDLDLLHHGSAIKIVATLMQFAGCGYFDSPLAHGYKKALEQGRLDHLPDFKIAVEYLFNCTDTGAIWKHSQSLYEKYIVGYFKELIGDESS